VSSDLPSPDDEVADNREVSPRVIGLAISGIMRLRITVRFLRVSSDLPSLDDEGETIVVYAKRR